jgi:hypothetical protein
MLAAPRLERARRAPSDPLHAAGDMRQFSGADRRKHADEALRIHKRISSRTSNRFLHGIRHKGRKLFIYGSLAESIGVFDTTRRAL